MHTLHSQKVGIVFKRKAPNRTRVHYPLVVGLKEEYYHSVVDDTSCSISADSGLWTWTCWLSLKRSPEQSGEKCILLGHHAASSDNSLWEFRGNLLVTSSLCPFKMGPIGCPEKSVRNYHYSLPNNPEERLKLLRAEWCLPVPVLPHTIFRFQKTSEA
jgi:hypothetical protein